MQPARILIVDDERQNRESLEAMLATEGFHLLAAASGEEALAMVTRQPPDLILLDSLMSGMDGYRVATEIKANAATQHIPIIMVTSLDDQDAVMLGLSAGTDDFLVRPVHGAELRVRVRKHVRRKAYGDGIHHEVLEDEVGLRTADLVTRTKTLEQQAAVLTEQAALLDLAQDAIVVRDMSGRIVLWSRGAELLYGWTSDDALARNANERTATDRIRRAHRSD